MPSAQETLRPVMPAPHSPSQAHLHAHSGGHGHDHAGASATHPAIPASPPSTLLSSGLVQRLAVALALAGVLWAVVVWSLTGNPGL